MVRGAEIAPITTFDQLMIIKLIDQSATLYLVISLASSFYLKSFFLSFLTLILPPPALHSFRLWDTSKGNAEQVVSVSVLGS